jgi:hypothetical protein
MSCVGQLIKLAEKDSGDQGHGAFVQAFAFANPV